MTGRHYTLSVMAAVSCGLGIAFLVAPKSTNEVRSKVFKKVRRTTGPIIHTAASFLETAADFIDKSIKEVERQKGGLVAGKRAYLRAVA